MKVSIISPTWNRAATLARTIESVETQSLRPFRHVIVDNLSEDDTPELVARYMDRAPYSVVHIRERDSGIYDAMNKGVMAAGGEALYFLNDDDRLFNPNSLKLMSKALSLAPEGIAFGDVLVSDFRQNTTRIRTHRQVNRLTLAEKSICQQATLYSRRAIEAVGPFDQSLKAAGDYDWMIRAMVRHSLLAVYLRHVVAVFAEGGISSDPSFATEFHEEMNHVANRHLSAAIRERANRYRRFWRKIPWGLSWCPGSEKSDRLRVISRSIIGNTLILDPIALFDF
jgi:glycosyltransferase involved in cell wall biosynthesis